MKLGARRSMVIQASNLVSAQGAVCDDTKRSSQVNFPAGSLHCYDTRCRFLPLEGAAATIRSRRKHL